MQDSGETILLGLNAVCDNITGVDYLFARQSEPRYLAPIAVERKVVSDYESTFLNAINLSKYNREERQGTTHSHLKDAYGFHNVEEEH